jgi:hypothetical protein
VMPSNKQLITRDFNFGALAQKEIRNPQTDKKGANSEGAQESSDASLRVRKRVTASVALWHAPADHRVSVLAWGYASSLQRCETPFETETPLRNTARGAGLCPSEYRRRPDVGEMLQALN